jgi:hypothetical protein
MPKSRSCGEIKSPAGCSRDKLNPATSWDGSTMRLGSPSSLPPTTLLTVLFLVDVGTGGIYWTPALAHHPVAGRASVTIKFEEGSDIRSDIRPLVGYLDSWFSLRSPETVLQEISQFCKMFCDMRSEIDHYDDPMDMHEEEHDKLRLFLTAHAEAQTRSWLTRRPDSGSCRLVCARSSNLGWPRESQLGHVQRTYEVHNPLL